MQIIILFNYTSIKTSNIEYFFKVDGNPILYGVADGKSSSFEAATNSGIIKVKKGKAFSNL